MKRLVNFISKSQLKALKDLQTGPEGAAAEEIINRLAAVIDAMPGPYATDGTPIEETTAWLHYFHAAGDWYIFEKDETPEQMQCFGYARLSAMPEMAEAGYISIQELIDNDIELDFYFEPRKFKECQH